jgi:hypothetical protein
MTAATIVALLITLLSATQAADRSAPQQRTIDLEFFDPYDRATYQFSISEGAYIAVFEIGGMRASLWYPAIGADLRRLRYGGASSLPEPSNFFDEGRHLLPPPVGRRWSGTAETLLMPTTRLLIVASKQPFRFERLNELYVGQGETFARHNSFGDPDDFVEVLLRTIVPNHDGDDWTAYLHEVRLETQRHAPR